MLNGLIINIYYLLVDFNVETFFESIKCKKNCTPLLFDYYNYLFNMSVIKDKRDKNLKKFIVKYTFRNSLKFLITKSMFD